MAMRDFPWFKSYPEGIPHEIGPYEHSSLIDLFDEACEKYADRVAFENMGVRLSFKDLHRKATAFAAYLQQDLGLRKGDRIRLLRSPGPLPLAWRPPALGQK